MRKRWPEHRNPTQPERVARAPYNFVPLPETVVTAVANPDQLPGHDRYFADRHSGFFDVTLTTCAPLYIRSPLTLEESLRKMEEQVKDRPDFFFTRDCKEPSIPGSSLRGMLRSLLEIAGHGKVQWVTEKRLFYRTVDTSAVGRHYTQRMVEGWGRSGDGFRPKVEGGFLRIQDRRFTIEPCTVARVEMQDVAKAFGLSSAQDLYDGGAPNGKPLWEYQHRTVWVTTEDKERDHLHSKGRYLRYLKVTAIQADWTPGFNPGVLVLTGHAPGHAPGNHMAFVFLPKPDSERIPVPNDGGNDPNEALFDRFHDDDQITKWQEGAFPKGQPEGAKRARNGGLRDGEPLFFLREGERLVFFGRAQLFRLPYRRRPLDLVPPELRRPQDIDYAEAIFGFVGEGKATDRRRGEGEEGRAYAGRVSVTDALLEPGQSEIWLSPDPVVPYILASPKPTAIQHYLTQQDPDNAKNLCHYDSPSPDQTVIRGHKLYWHRGEVTLEDIQETRRLEEKDTQHTRMRPVKPGVRFRFRVYFENLSDAELGALCWVLQPRGEAGKEYRHKLGMGKPLGMGAVKLQPRLHLIDRRRRYSSLFAGPGWSTGEGGVEDLTDAAVLERRVRPFEEHVLGVLREHGRTYQRMRDVPRIGMLLSLLSWPGPQKQSTEYMGINEFKGRPVLPDPWGVLRGCRQPEDAGGGASPPPGAPGGGASSSSPRRESPAQPALREVGATRSAPPSRPAGAGSGIRKAKETVELVEKLGPTKFRVRTNRGETAVCSNVPGYPEPLLGSRFQALVNRRDGRIEKVIFKGWAATRER